MTFCQPVSHLQPIAVNEVKQFLINTTLPWTMLGSGCAQEGRSQNTQVKTRKTTTKLRRDSIIPRALCSRVVGLMEANTLQTAQSSCATLKCFLRNNCCTEAVCPAEQLHSRCDLGEVLIWLGTFQNTSSGHQVVSLMIHPPWTSSRGLCCIATQQLVLIPQPERDSLKSLKSGTVRRDSSNWGPELQVFLQHYLTITLHIYL